VTTLHGLPLPVDHGPLFREFADQPGAGRGPGLRHPGRRLPPRGRPGGPAGHPVAPRRVTRRPSNRPPAGNASAKSTRFDLAVQLHGSGSFVNRLVALFGAARTAGFFLPGDYCADPELFLP
jgi:hypothetical protein